jgi:ribosome-associated toxin RatA of RatAB toxin-antitoxin module
MLHRMSTPSAMLQVLSCASLLSLAACVSPLGPSTKSVAVSHVASVLDPMPPRAPSARGEAERYRVDAPASDVDVGGAAITVHGSMERVLAVVQSYPRYREIMPRVEQSRVVGKSEGGTEVYLQAPILGGVARVWGIARFSPPEPWEDGGRKIVATMVKGNLRSWHGVWKLTPCGEECTVLQLEMHIELKLPVPASSISGETAWACDKAVTSVRDLVEEGTHSVADG